MPKLLTGMSKMDLIYVKKPECLARESGDESPIPYAHRASM
jgi:hypothetical protein